MTVGPRRKARQNREGRNWQTASSARCVHCGKAMHPSRSAAKKAIKAWHTAERTEVQAYECEPDSGRWHIGHKTPSWIRARRAA